MRGAVSRSPTHATHGVPCLACTGESNCPQFAKNNLILRQCEWSRREDTPPTASEVANMDMVEVIVGVLLLSLVTGVVYYRLQQSEGDHSRPTRRIFWRSHRDPGAWRGVLADSDSVAAWRSGLKMLRTAHRLLTKTGNFSNAARLAPGRTMLPEGSSSLRLWKGMATSSPFSPVKSPTARTT